MAWQSWIHFWTVIPFIYPFTFIYSFSHLVIQSSWEYVLNYYSMNPSGSLLIWMCTKFSLLRLRKTNRSHFDFNFEKSFNTYIYLHILKTWCPLSDLIMHNMIIIHPSLQSTCTVYINLFSCLESPPHQPSSFVVYRLEITLSPGSQRSLVLTIFTSMVSFQPAKDFQIPAMSPSLGKVFMDELF